MIHKKHFREPAIFPALALIKTASLLLGLRLLLAVALADIPTPPAENHSTAAPAPTVAASSPDANPATPPAQDAGERYEQRWMLIGLMVVLLGTAVWQRTARRRRNS